MNKKYWNKRGDFWIQKSDVKRQHRLACKTKLAGSLDKTCRHSNVNVIDFLLDQYNNDFKKLSDKSEIREFNCYFKILRDWRSYKLSEEAILWGESEVRIDDGIFYNKCKKYSYEYTENEDGYVIRDEGGNIIDMFLDDDVFEMDDSGKWHKVKDDKSEK